MSLRTRTLAAVSAFVRGTVTAPAGAVVPTGEQGPAERWLSGRRVGATDQARELTADRISGMLRQADDGDPRALFALLDTMLDRDTHMLGVLNTRFRAVSNLGWAVVPTGKTPAEADIAQEVTTILQRAEGIESMFLDLVDATYKGIAFSEIEWALDAGRLVPVRFHHRPQRWFRPDLDKPDVWRLLDSVDPTFGVPLEPHKWLIHTSRARPAFPIQAGLGRTLTWWYLFKLYGIKDWVSYVEKYGAPLRIGKYPPGTDPADIAELDAMVRQLGIDASATIPSDMTVDIVADAGGKTGADTFQRLLDFANAEVSKAVLGSTLTVETTGTGSFALGEVHNDVRTDLRDADARELGRTLTGQLVKEIVELNWGAKAPVPRFEFITSQDDEVAREERRRKRGEVLTIAHTLGLPVSLRQVREELGVDAVEAGEAVLPAAVGAPATGTFSAIRKGGRVLLGAAVGQEQVILGPFNAILQAAQAAVRKAWAGIIRGLRAELGDEVEESVLRERIAAALRTVDLTPYVNELADATLRAEGLGLAQARAERSDSDLQLPSTSPASDTKGWAKATGLSVEEWAARAQRHTDAAQDTARYAMLKASEDLLRAATAEAGGIDAAVDQVSQAPSRTDAVVDGGATKSWGEGRWEGLTSNTKGRLYLRYHTMQDNRVRPTHRAMEGKVYPIDHPIWRVWRPPNGFGCRCWVTVHTYEEVIANGWEIAEDYPEIEVKGGGTKPVLPDTGWAQADKDAPVRDLTGVPEAWVEAIDAAEAKQAAKRAAKGGA